MHPPHDQACPGWHGAEETARPRARHVYARLRRCGDLACTGRPFTEHRNVPVLTVHPGDPRPAYRQIADTLAETIRSGQLRAGERLPSVREMSEGDMPTASARNALAVLTEEGLITSVFSNDPAGATAWNPDWTSHQVAVIASRAGVSMNVKSLRHYTATQLLSGGIDLRNTAARLGHGDGGATTLKHYADPISEVDRRAAAYLSDLTAAARLAPT
jgi:hypothetical protein